MRSRLRLWTVAVLALGLLAPGASVWADKKDRSDEDKETFREALTKGKFGLSLRYRFEHVDDDNFAKDGNASTLRTTGWYRTAGYRGFRGFVQFEDVTDLGLDDDHNSGLNGVTSRPAVIDPANTKVHQANISYTGLKDTKFVAGRSEIVLDDARFVGNVLWRQNFQSYNTVMFTQESIARTKITYAHISRVNNVRTSRFDANNNLLNLNFDLDKAGTLVVYHYSLDFDGNALPSTASTGASWHGAAKSGEFKFPFRIEYASQSDTGDNPNNVDADYFRGLFGFNRGPWTVTLLYEKLSGSAQDGQFTTPLATLFKFNGWADKFLATPTNGLVDMALTAKYKKGPFLVLLSFHDFEADTGGAGYGDETDFRFIYTAPSGQAFWVQAALFSGENGFTDTNKYWAMTSFKF